MNNNRLTLIIDGNWLLLSRAFILHSYLGKDADPSLKAEGRARLIDMTARGITVMTNRFPMIDNIVFVEDGGSWRKSLSRPSCYKETYKGNREGQGIDIDYDTIWGAMKDISSRLQAIGMTVSRADNIEGDDWIWHWTETLNRQGTNCIIWSIDNDLKQLVRMRAGGAITVWYNDRSGLFLPECLKEKEIDDAAEFFLSPPPAHSAIAEDLKHHCHVVSYINPDDIIMSKIICGDAGDNIASVCRLEKNGKMYGVGPYEWSYIKSNLNIASLDDFFANRDNIIAAICSKRNKKDEVVRYDDVNQMFDFNTRLVRLNTESYPPQILEVMASGEYMMFDVSQIRNNYQVMTRTDSQNDAMNSIFEGIS